MILTGGCTDILIDNKVIFLHFQKLLQFPFSLLRHGILKNVYLPRNNEEWISKKWIIRHWPLTHMFCVLEVIDLCGCHAYTFKFHYVATKSCEGIFLSFSVRYVHRLLRLVSISINRRCLGALDSLLPLAKTYVWSCGHTSSNHS